MFYSDAKQDEFVARLLSFAKNGFFIDIGSCGAIESNNTFFFEALDWNGICIEMDPRYNESYSLRKCVYINDDALKLDYKKTFKKLKVPNVIDYLSLDIDTNSLNVLKILPFKSYKFKIITIEHDSYLYGDIYQKEQTSILKSNGYFKLFENVYVQQAGFNREKCSFEDWWIHPELIDKNIVEKLKDSDLYPSQIIDKIKLNS
jgi:hypothetical protein